MVVDAAPPVVPYWLSLPQPQLSMRLASLGIACLGKKRVGVAAAVLEFRIDTDTCTDDAAAVRRAKTPGASAGHADPMPSAQCGGG